MLDGLLGRGFASKCKSLIKLSKSRIDVIRRKRSATQKFLKKDIADLLANGLDINAYGRAEGLLMEVILSSCYDFVERCCDIVSGHVSLMQKQSECPEECKEAVSSLMFAAARFSDLPELRDLRDMFHERYGNSLELFVNQKFVENLASSPSTMEKKVQLMQDIASEFSIKWDSRAFEQRMSKPSPSSQDEAKSYKSFHNNGGINKSADSKNVAVQGVSLDALSKERLESSKDGHQLWNGKERNNSKRNELVNQSGYEVSKDKYMPLYEKDEPILIKKHHDISFYGTREPAADKLEAENVKGDTALKTVRLSSSSYRKRTVYVDGGSTAHDGRENTVSKRDSHDSLPRSKPDIAPTCAGLHSPRPGDQHNVANSTNKVQEEGIHKLKPYFNNAIPPPYVKPNVKPKDNKYEASVVGSSHGGSNEIRVVEDLSNHNRGYAGSRSKMTQEGSDFYEHEGQIAGTPRASSHGHGKDLHYLGNGIANQIPKPRSLGRRHLKSPSHHDDANTAEDSGVAKRKPRSRRRDDSRRGLQILFDYEHYQNDEEERMIDKLLLHYSKKPLTYEEGRVRRKSRSRRSHHQVTDPGGSSPHNRARDASDDLSEMVPQPVRSISLPREQTTASETKKVFARAASFQPDRSSEARHVHPKLPDYDDLAARIAALRGGS